jgi:hypothetical protein
VMASTGAERLSSHPPEQQPECSEPLEIASRTQAMTEGSLVADRGRCGDAGPRRGMMCPR